MLELSAERITDLTYFLDTETLFPLFGLPEALPAQGEARSIGK